MSEVVLNNAIIVGSFLSSLPVNPFVDKLYSYEGKDNILIGGINWRLKDFARYNGSIWENIPFSLFLKYYVKSDYPFNPSFLKGTAMPNTYPVPANGDIYYFTSFSSNVETYINFLDYESDPIEVDAKEFAALIWDISIGGWKKISLYYYTDNVFNDKFMIEDDYLYVRVSADGVVPPVYKKTTLSN